MRRVVTHAALPVAALTLAVLTSVAAAQVVVRPYAERVEVRRTHYGVPHLLADDLGALGFGLAWVQLEDHGLRVVVELVRARGDLARAFGRDSIDADFVRRRFHAHAVATYHLLASDTRDLLEGYAAGVNAYVAGHGDEFPAWVRPVFTGHDAAALWVDETTAAKVRVFRARQAARLATADTLATLDQGSNAWAFAPSRTTSGRAILLRNPHLSWDAGYYEVHLTVPGVINFYGDFRVGHPLYFNGGFNDRLGWATTNNNPDLEEIYALDVDPDRPDHYRFDGAAVPLERVPVTVEFRNGPGLATETREVWRTPLGPVVDRADGKVYVVRSPAWEEYRRVEQFLRMMQARSLAEWRSAVAMRAHVESNLTYADRDGNIYYVWNATVPRLPTASGGDTAAIPAARSADVWTAIVPFDSLPQVLNPRGGYVQNANDPFHYTNLHAIHDSTRFPDPFPRPALGLRSQLSLRLAQHQRKMSLEDVVRLKYDYTCCWRSGCGTTWSGWSGPRRPPARWRKRSASSNGGTARRRRPPAAARCSRCGSGDTSPPTPRTPARTASAGPVLLPSPGRRRCPPPRRGGLPTRRGRWPPSRRRWTRSSTTSARRMSRGETCTESAWVTWTCPWGAARAGTGASGCSATASRRTACGWQTGATAGCWRSSSAATARARTRCWPTARVPVPGRRTTRIRRPCSRGES